MQSSSPLTRPRFSVSALTTSSGVCANLAQHKNNARQYSGSSSASSPFFFLRHARRGNPASHQQARSAAADASSIIDSSTSRDPFPSLETSNGRTLDGNGTAIVADSITLSASPNTNNTRQASSSNGNGNGNGKLHNGAQQEATSELPAQPRSLTTSASSTPARTPAAPYTFSRALHALYLFSRPHTMLGTTLSVISISLLALGAAPPSPLLTSTASTAVAQVSLNLCISGKASAVMIADVLTASISATQQTSTRLNRQHHDCAMVQTCV